MAELDPMRSSMRWGWISLEERSRTFKVGILLLGLVLAAMTAILAPPEHAAVIVRVGYALAGFLLSIGLVMGSVLIYQLVVAPYQQRNALRVGNRRLANDLHASVSEATRRQQPAYRSHLSDQHHFAESALEIIRPMTRMGRVNGHGPVEVVGPAFRDFEAHFPVAAAATQEWDHAAGGYQAAAPRLDSVLIDQAKQLKCDATGNGLPGLLRLIAIHHWGVADVTWYVSDGTLRTVGPQEGVAGFTICEMPIDLHEATRLLINVWACIEDLPSRPEVIDWHHFWELMESTRQRVADELEAAIRTHHLTGTCERCP